MIRQQQQGDVLIAEVASLPKNAKKKPPDNGKCVLAYGEVSNHMHAIADTENCEVWTAEDRQFLKVHARVTLTHEEHHAQIIEPGVYEFWQVRERDFLSGMVNPVAD